MRTSSVGTICINITGMVAIVAPSPSLNESNYDLVNNDEQASWFPLCNLDHEGSLTNYLHFPLIRTILGSREAHLGVTNIRETPWLNGKIEKG